MEVSMTKRKNPYVLIDDDLDDEERESLEGILRGDYVSVPDLEQSKKEWKEAIANTHRKKPITVRIQVGDIDRIRVKALQLGMPYQTLLSSIIHQYASGMLVPKD
jgi:predicted DNA binding CopG/RHH family protein